MAVSLFVHIIALLPVMISTACPVNAAGSSGTAQATKQHIHIQKLRVPQPSVQQDTTIRRLSLQIVASGLNEATSIDITPDNEIYVVEAGGNRILKLDRNGLRMDSLGRMGFGDYRFDRPLDVEATNGLKIYVTDYNNRRIQVFDRRLQFLSTVDPAEISGHGQAFRPTSITVNAFGELFVLDEEQVRLLKLDRNGRYVFELDLRVQGIRALPTSLESAGNMLFLPDPVHGIIHLISDSGNYVRFIGGLEPGSAIGASPGGTIWAVSGSEVHEFDQRGRVLRTFALEMTGNATSVAAGKEYLYILISDRIFRSAIPSRTE
ncbi:MAG: NHL repeat-containing protein [Cyclonatronaceae bacterium]